MCVAALAWNAHRDWQLVAIGNRDEYHQRPAAPLAVWEEGIIAGRDLQSGGTWLGVTGQRFALITNLRGHGLPDPAKASRGALVTDLLSGNGIYSDPTTAPLDAFNPFNLLLVAGKTLHFLSSHPSSSGEGPGVGAIHLAPRLRTDPAPTQFRVVQSPGLDLDCRGQSTPKLLKRRGLRTTLTHGIYGLSNGALDEPWPKTLQLKAALSDWLVSENPEVELLFAALRNEQIEPIGLVPDEPSDITDEAALTPVFIRRPVYGTRCSTVVLVDRAGLGQIVERSFDQNGLVTGETAVSFVWPG